MIKFYKPMDREVPTSVWAFDIADRTVLMLVERKERGATSVRFHDTFDEEDMARIEDHEDEFFKAADAALIEVDNLSSSRVLH